MIYLLHAWGDDETTLVPVGEKLGLPFECLRGGRRADSGYAWTSWESDDPRDVGRARRRVERLIRPGSALLGFSQGAMLALEVAFAGRSHVSAVVAIGAFLARGGLARPRARIRSSPRVLLLHGRADDAVPPSEAKIVLERLRPFAPVELRLVPGSHEITERMIGAARRFLT